MIINITLFFNELHEEFEITFRISWLAEVVSHCITCILIHFDKCHKFLMTQKHSWTEFQISWYLDECPLKD